MTEIPNKSSPRQYSFLHFISLSPKGGILVYMNLYLKRVGLNGSQLGTVAAIFSFMSIFSSPIWGIIADSVKDMRRIIVLLFLSASLVYPLLLFTKNCRQIQNLRKKSRFMKGSECYRALFLTPPLFN